MKRLLLATTLAALLPLGAHATVIASFSQNSPNDTIHATVNGGATVTTLTATDASTDISALFGNPAVPAALFSLDAHSIDAAVTFLGAIVQHYAGSFCFTSAAGCTGINYLSGVFTDAAFGAAGGPGLTININNPPDSLTLSSDVIAAADLIAPNSASFGFTNIATPPGITIDNTTIGAFDAAFAGTVSASVATAPEPATIALLGFGLLGLAAVRKRA